MRGLNILSAAVVFLALPVLANSAQVGVLHFKAVGVTEETAEAVATLLVNDLVGYGYSVLNPEAMDAAAGTKISCFENECAAEAGTRAQVGKVIIGSVSALGEKHVVQVSVVDVITKQSVWTGSLAAKTAEDLDIVTKRLAKAIATGQKPQEGPEIGLITEQEVTQEEKRKESFAGTGLNLTWLFPMGGYADATALMGSNVLASFEAPNWLAAFGAGYYYSLGASSWDPGFGEPSVMDMTFDISIDYFFLRSDFSPFIGGSMGLDMLWLTSGSGPTYESSMNTGMLFKGVGGIALLRTYDFHILINTGYSLSTAELEHYSGPHHGILINLGIIYRFSGRRGCGGPGFGASPGCFF